MARKCKNLPKQSTLATCPYCLITNKFRVYGRTIGKKKYLYFECCNCKKLVRGRTA